MCGITGFVTPAGSDRPEARRVLQAMTDALQHRGPDAGAVWQNDAGQVGLGHRRLSIVDLSVNGAQPMASPDGRFVVTFNGEIYNHRALRAELIARGETFRGTSDTEVMLRAFALWGLRPALRRLNGMFAFALWDERDRTLWLARDKFGEKPLYYAWQKGMFLFGSELKALIAHPAFDREIDRAALTRLVTYGYIGEAQSIFAGTHKLRPGYLLAVTPGGAREPEAYWSPTELLGARKGLPRSDDRSLIDELDEQLRRAVRERMMADVPLGAFLSGGIDSSVVVAAMQTQSSRPVKTFTIGFENSGYDEAADAARVARHLGTVHHELYLSGADCIETLLRVPEAYDEPFADSSQIPTMLISRFARRHVTVALSGDAGDELFGGYNRYVWAKRLWSRYRHFPSVMRRVTRTLIRSIRPHTWDCVIRVANYAVPAALRVRSGGDKMAKFAGILEAESLDALYLELVADQAWARKVLRAPRPIAPPFAAFRAAVHPLGEIERMMFFDQVSYLPDDILCKVDRASMAASLEARVPLLDPDLAAFAWSLPIDFKIRHGVGKWPLREVLKRYVPAAMFERPKMGFALPVGDWLRGPLRDWAEALLARERGEGTWFDGRVLRATWEEHCSGRRAATHQLWPVLMFLAWEQRWAGVAAQPASAPARASGDRGVVGNDGRPM